MHPLLSLFRASLERMKANLKTRIQNELTNSGSDNATVTAKMQEVDTALGNGTILEWLVTNLPQLIAELGPLIQAILTLLAMFGK